MRLSIHQTNAQIGIQTNLASTDMKSPRGDLSIEQHPAVMEIESPPGELEIDSSAAWDALSLGGHLTLMNFIYSQIPGVFMQALAKKVEDGNRMAQITNSNNAFAEIASRYREESMPIQCVGDASFLNVKMQYYANPPSINIEPQKADIEYTPIKPQVEYNPGNVEVYIQQRNSIDIQVSQYDWYQ